MKLTLKVFRVIQFYLYYDTRQKITNLTKIALN